jgi:hypothetical protein
MLAVFFIILVVCLAGFSAAGYLLLESVSRSPNDWVALYYTQARIPMFTGFLTLGSFLLTLQTAIIHRLKEAYDSADHARKIGQLRAKGKSVRYYGSLERVGVALSTNVILALVTALLQMSLGFVQTVWSTAICSAFGLTALLLVIYLTIQMVLAHQQWFKKIEEDKSTPQPKDAKS